MAAASIEAGGVRAVVGQGAGGGLLAPGATRSAEVVILLMFVVVVVVVDWVVVRMVGFKLSWGV
jgi:hypothetical protein